MSGTSGTVLGLLAFLLLVILLIPPLRLTWVDRYLIPLTAAYKIHHHIALTLMIVIAAHVALVMAPFLRGATKPGEYLSVLFDLRDLSVLSGWIAWLGLTIPTLSGLASHLPRRKWLWLHRSAYGGFIASCCHVFVSWSTHFEPLHDLADLGRLMLGLAAGCVASGFFVQFLSPGRLASRQHFCVAHVEKVAPELSVIDLSLAKGPNAWAPGDIGFFRFKCEGRCAVSQEAHPFTVTETKASQLRIFVKNAGDDTAKIQHIEVGTSGEAIGPYTGLASACAQRKRQLWLAGGLGVVAFLGILRRPRTIPPKSDIVLVYLRRPDTTGIFLNDLLHIAAIQSGLRIISLERTPANEAHLDDISREVSDWRERDIAIAGPHAMVTYWSTQFKRGGMKRWKIHTEDFLKT